MLQLALASSCHNRPATKSGRRQAFKPCLPALQVITICKGAAQRSDLFSTFGHGRLFVYADGDIGFLFIAGEQPALVDYTRIDADLA